MQALVRAQALIRARRARKLLNDAASYKFHSKRHDPGAMETPKIVEMDTCKSRSGRMRSNDHMSSPLPGYPQLEWGLVSEEYYKFATAQNTPRLSHSDRIVKSPATPASSVYGESFLSSNNPNYMTNTESFRAKVRSQSAPRQRLLVNEVMGRRSSFSGVRMHKSSWCHQAQQGF